MRASVAVVAAALLLLASYSTGYYIKYLNVTATTLLDNKRLLLQYARCIVGDGPCTPTSREIKKLFPEMMASSCSLCDIKLRRVFERCVELMEIYYPSKLAKFLPPLEQNDV